MVILHSHGVVHPYRSAAHSLIPWVLYDPYHFLILMGLYYPDLSAHSLIPWGLYSPYHFLILMGLNTALTFQPIPSFPGGCTTLTIPHSDGTVLP